MKTIKFKVNPKIIREANRISVVENRRLSDNTSYNGVVTARIVLNGVEKTRELSRQDINDAYLKSLQEYAEKL